MTQRDYIKKKIKAKNTSRLIPKLMMAMAIILIILFIVILYLLSTNKTNKRPSSTPIITEKPQIVLPDKPQERWTYLKELENPDGSMSPSSNSSSTNTNSTQSELSSQQKERQKILDSFVNDKTATKNIKTDHENTNTQALQNKKEQQSSITEPVKITQTGRFLLQCGAFKDKTNAESLKAKIAMTGTTSFIEHDKIYRVFVGPYTSKKAVEQQMAILKANAITNCIIKSK